MAKGTGQSRHAPQKAERRWRGPGKPTEVSGRFATLKRTFREFQEDNMTDWAAALTYYGVLAFFPALIAFVGDHRLLRGPC